MATRTQGRVEQQQNPTGRRWTDLSPVSGSLAAEWSGLTRREIDLALDQNLLLFVSKILRQPKAEVLVEIFLFTPAALDLTQKRPAVADLMPQHRSSFQRRNVFRGKDWLSLAALVASRIGTGERLEVGLIEYEGAAGHLAGQRCVRNLLLVGSGCGSGAGYRQQD